MFYQSDEVNYNGTFARTVLLNNECPDFLTSDELDNILTVICTD